MGNTSVQFKFWKKLFKLSTTLPQHHVISYCCVYVSNHMPFIQKHTFKNIHMLKIVLQNYLIQTYQ